MVCIVFITSTKLFLCKKTRKRERHGGSNIAVKVLSTRKENGLSFPMVQNKKGYIIWTNTQSRSHLEIGHTYRRNFYYKFLFLMIFTMRTISFFFPSFLIFSLHSLDPWIWLVNACLRQGYHQFCSDILNVVSTIALLKFSWVFRFLCYKLI